MRNEGYGNGRAYSSTGIAVGKGNEDGRGIGFGEADDPEGTAWVPHGYSLGGFQILPDIFDEVTEMMTAPVTPGMPPA